MTKNNKPSEPASPRHEHLIQVLTAIHKVNQLIMAEKNPARLLGEVCRLLTETRGYHNAWCVLEKNGKPVEPFFHSGFGDRFEPMAERLRTNQPPHCVKETLESNSILVIDDPPSQCADCPLAKEYEGRASLIARLRHEDHDFGLLCASVPKTAAIDAEEQTLFADVAHNIAHALWSIKANTRFQELAQMLPEVVFESDIDLNITYTNQRGFELFGYTKEDLATRTKAFELIIPEDRARAGEILARRIQGETLGPNEYQALRKDGSTFPVLLNISPIMQEGEIFGFRGVIVDISERVLSEKALREGEAKYRLLAENATDVIWTMDMNLRFTFISQSTTALRGYTHEEAMAQSMEEMITPESLARVMEIFGRHLQLLESGDEAVWEPVAFEADQTCKDGTIVSTGNNAKFIKGPDGLPILIVGVTHDITARKQAEEERATLESQLNQAQKMESIGRLAGGVAHDFNNLLTVINSYAEFATEDLREEDPLRADLLQILDAGKRAATLTRQLLAFSRKQVLEPKVLCLNEIVVDLEKMLRRLIGEDIELSTSLAGDLGHITADPGQIEQVLMNLAVNAKDAMPKGGKLEIKTIDVELSEAYSSKHPDRPAGRYTMLAVSDTGLGMTDEVRNRIFDPFFTTKEIGQGTGLGLSTAYGIIKQSGGFIAVFSEPGEGTTFEVYLPRAEAKDQAQQDEPQFTDLRGHETILVVEDEKAVRKLTRRILSSAGYKVLSAANGGEALLECERHEGKIHLVLTDVVMPRMSGKELSARLTKVFPNLKVLFMSGYTDDAIVHHGILDEGTHFLAKPFTSPELLKKIRVVLADKDTSPA